MLHPDLSLKQSIRNAENVCGFLFPPHQVLSGMGELFQVQIWGRSDGD